jgi:hypothetical protein
VSWSIARTATCPSEYLRGARRKCGMDGFALSYLRCGYCLSISPYQLVLSRTCCVTEEAHVTNAVAWIGTLTLAVGAVTQKIWYFPLYHGDCIIAPRTQIAGTTTCLLTDHAVTIITLGPTPAVHESCVSAEL